MGNKSVYEISRFDVCTDNEVLIERAQLFHEDGALRCRVDEGPKRVCTESNVIALIGADPALGEIRANQVTRITCQPSVLAELPFILRIPGRRDDFDESLWSEAMSDEHIDEDEGQSGVYRVLYVDGARWSAWQTSEGVRMLPGAGPLVDVSPWGYLSFCENGSMTSGLDESVFGLATPIAVVSATLLDPLSWGEDTAVVLRRRGKSTVDDAAMFVEWLLDGGLARGYFTEEVPLLQAMLAQLFVEASINNFNGVSVPGSRLAAGAEAPLDFGDADSSEWILKVDLDEDFTKVVLDSLAQRSPRLAEIVTAAREPDSPAGLARRAALEAWSQTFSWADYYDSQEQRQRSSY